jgi:hypothetical protein
MDEAELLQLSELFDSDIAQVTIRERLSTWHHARQEQAEAERALLRLAQDPQDPVENFDIVDTEHRPPRKRPAAASPRPQPVKLRRLSPRAAPAASDPSASSAGAAASGDPTAGDAVAVVDQPAMAAFDSDTVP